MTSSGVDWSTVQGASKKPKHLHLVSDEKGIFQCPVVHCDHMGFSCQRGCRKHVKNKHGWVYYFDVKPDLKSSRTNVRPQAFCWKSLIVHKQVFHQGHTFWT